MKKLSILCGLLIACGGAGTTTITQPVIKEAVGKALQPNIEFVPAATAFSTSDTSKTTQTFSIEGGDLTKLWPLLVAVQAAPATFGSSLTMTAQASTSATAEILVSSSGKTDAGCTMTFAMSPFTASANCGKDLVNGLKLVPAPSKVDLTMTLTAGNQFSLAASLTSPSGAPRTLAYAVQGSVTQIALEKGQTLDKLSGTTVSGVVNVAAPSTGVADLTATVLFIVDYNADGIVGTDEVTSGTATLGEDVQISSIVTAAAAEKLLTGALKGPLNYVLVIGVQSKSGNISASAAQSGLDTKASLSIVSTATTKAATK